MIKTIYCGRPITCENRRIIEEQIALICEISRRLNVPYKSDDNMTIETAITETLKKLLIESARKITLAADDSIE